MIALGLLVVCLLCDRFKPRQQLEAEILVLPHQLNICSSAREVDRICVGSIVLCSSGSIVAVLSFLTL